MIGTRTPPTQYGSPGRSIVVLVAAWSTALITGMITPQPAATRSTHQRRLRAIDHPTRRRVSVKAENTAKTTVLTQNPALNW